MDNLSVHKSKWAREPIEDKDASSMAPAQLLLAGLQSYIRSLREGEGLLRKAKVRTLEILFEVTREALYTVSEEDARGYFRHYGYVTPQTHTRRIHYESRSRGAEEETAHVPPLGPKEDTPERNVPPSRCAGPS